MQFSGKEGFISPYCFLRCLLSHFTDATLLSKSPKKLIHDVTVWSWQEASTCYENGELRSSMGKAVWNFGISIHSNMCNTYFKTIMLQSGGGFKYQLNPCSSETSSSSSLSCLLKSSIICHKSSFKKRFLNAEMHKNLDLIFLVN